MMICSHVSFSDRVDSPDEDIVSKVQGQHLASLGNAVAPCTMHFSIHCFVLAYITRGYEKLSVPVPVILLESLLSSFSNNNAPVWTAWCPMPETANWYLIQRPGTYCCYVTLWKPLHSVWLSSLSWRRCVVFVRQRVKLTLFPPPNHQQAINNKILPCGMWESKYIRDLAWDGRDKEENRVRSVGRAAAKSGDSQMTAQSIYNRYENATKGLPLFSR